jgi:ATP-dependent Lon protease
MPEKQVRELPAMFFRYDFLPLHVNLTMALTQPKGLHLLKSLALKPLTEYCDELDFYGTFAIILYNAKDRMDRELILRSVKNDFDGWIAEAKIVSCQKIAGEKEAYKVEYQCLRKVKLLRITSDYPCFYVKVGEEMSGYVSDVRKAEAAKRDIFATVKQLAAINSLRKDMVEFCGDNKNLVTFPDLFINVLIAEKKQIIFTANDFRGLFTEADSVLRLQLIAKKLNDFFVLENEGKRAREDIDKKVREVISDGQKEYSLRLKKRALETELEQIEKANSPKTTIEDLAERITNANMSPEAEDEAVKQWERLQTIPKEQNEHSIVLNYLNWLCDVPWCRQSEEEQDISKVRQALDDGHYGLDKPKKILVENIAVRKLNPNKRDNILCFVGPPGCGKTSLGQAIGKAVGRKFVKISVGGVRDEAAIRGHRRTYVGALPGMIMVKMKAAGTINPVFLIDEVDKMGNDMKGDPVSALLEVLDPEQNHSFSDNYFGVSYDLSHVMFICTANVLSDIPAVLRDRMQVIQLPGYAPQEKLQIVKRHLLPKQLNEHGLAKSGLRIADETLLAVMDFYTREGGVRNLERCVCALLRERATLAAQGKRYKREITMSDAEKILGPPQFDRTERLEVVDPGIVTGLAWTSYGGDTLIIESTKMPRLQGETELLYTGNLGDVMKESVYVAFNCARKYIMSTGMDLAFLEKLKIHLHCPEGGIKKDGPSAGAAMTLAFVSLMLNKPIRSGIAMTGEIDLREGGHILPIGGVKEKLLAAHRAGYDTVFIPERNKKDLTDVPQEVKDGLTIIPVSNIAEVIDLAL